MNDSGKTGIFYIVADVVFFMAMISVLVWVSKRLTTFTYTSADNMQINITSAENDSLGREYKGYSGYGQTMYDGTIYGADVITDIRNMKLNGVYVYVGSMCLNTTAYDSEHTYLEYIQQEDASPLNLLVNAKKQYTRKYTYNTAGDIQSVTYQMQ